MKPNARTVLLFCIGAAFAQLAAGASCPVDYSTETNAYADPLLYGGYYKACKSGCQPRDSLWAETCQLDPRAYAAWGVCESWQRSKPHDIARSLSGGDIDKLSPCDFYNALGNRTLWIIGDSHAKVMYYSLRCFMMDFWDHQQGECASSGDKMLQKQLELASAQGHPYNNPPRCLHFINSRARICLVHNPIGTYLVSEDAQNPGVLQVLNEGGLASPDDVLYVGFGHWHANNCEGIHPSYAAALENFGVYAQAARISGTMPNLIFGVAPHEHTKCEGRAFNFSTPVCYPPEQGNYDLSIGPQVASMAHNILSKYNMPIIDSYNVSLALYNSHVTAEQSIAGQIDCLHFCRPSLGEIDIWKLHTYMVANKPGHTTAAATTDEQQQEQPVHTCVYIEPLLYKAYGPIDVSAVKMQSVQQSLAAGEGRQSLWKRCGWIKQMTARLLKRA